MVIKTIQLIIVLRFKQCLVLGSLLAYFYTGDTNIHAHAQASLEVPAVLWVHVPLAYKSALIVARARHKYVTCRLAPLSFIRLLTYSFWRIYVMLQHHPHHEYPWPTLKLIRLKLCRRKIHGQQEKLLYICSNWVIIIFHMHKWNFLSVGSFKLKLFSWKFANNL